MCDIGLFGRDGSLPHSCLWRPGWGWGGVIAGTNFKPIFHWEQCMRWVPNAKKPRINNMKSIRPMPEFCIGDPMGLGQYDSLGSIVALILSPLCFLYYCGQSFPSRFFALCKVAVSIVAFILPPLCFLYYCGQSFPSRFSALCKLPMPRRQWYSYIIVASLSPLGSLLSVSSPCPAGSDILILLWPVFPL